MDGPGNFRSSSSPPVFRVPPLPPPPRPPAIHTPIVPEATGPPPAPARRKKPGIPLEPCAVGPGPPGFFPWSTFFFCPWVSPPSLTSSESGAPLVPPVGPISPHDQFPPTPP